MQHDDLLIIAHRGASGIVNSDNDAAAFTHAIALGCDYIETDLRRCGDGSIVCFHDADINGHALAELSFAELQSHSPTNLLTLDQFLTLCAGKIGLDIELKESGFEEELLAALSQYNIDDQVIIKSFNSEALLNLRKLQCPYPVGLLIGGPHGDQDLASHLRACRAVADEIDINFISPVKSIVCDEFFFEEHFGNIQCLVWTIDKAEEMRHYLQFPIHGIITNRPDILSYVCKKPQREHSKEAIEHAIKTLTHEELIAFLNNSSHAGAGISTRTVDIGANARHRVLNWAQTCWPQTHDGAAKICAVYDADRSEAFIKDMVNLDVITTSIALEKMQPYAHLTPHDSYVKDLCQQAAGFDGIIAVGSGTVNDICKLAAFQLDIPYISLATAPSMNGYSSGIAALLVNDLKSTVPCTPPVVVISDPEILQNAPLELLQSGYADLLSKFVSVSDWKLASLIRGEDFSDLPGNISGAAIDQCVRIAEQIKQRERKACTELMHAIILSGYSMALAGSSAPASGGEHLISHYLDMTAYAEQRCPDLHGLQVALGTLLTSRLYEYLRDLDPKTLQARLYSENELKHAHGQLWDIVAPTATAQIKSDEEAKQRIGEITSQWNALWTKLDPYLKPHDEIRRALASAGVACNPEAYGISRALMKTALCFAADIRDRYTVLHFARDCGVLEQCADDIIASAFY